MLHMHQRRLGIALHSYKVAREGPTPSWCTMKITMDIIELDKYGRMIGVNTKTVDDKEVKCFGLEYPLLGEVKTLRISIRDWNS